MQPETLTVKLLLPWPPSVNNYWHRSRSGGMFVSKAGTQFRAKVSEIAVGCERNKMRGRVSVWVKAYPPDRRARDLDNILKATLDALQDAGVYESDSQIDMLLVERYRSIKGGQVEVQIHEMHNTTQEGDNGSGKD